MSKLYVLYGNASGELHSDSNIVEFYKMMKNIKEFDRSNGIQDTYYCELHISDDEECSIYDVKIYRRGNKIFCKGL